MVQYTHLLLVQRPAIATDLASQSAAVANAAVLLATLAGIGFGGQVWG